MKRLKDLYPQIYDFENLHQAYLKARMGKRYRSEVLAFTASLEENLIQIQNELIHRKYSPGPYREFYVHGPKRRLIMALPFKDRVVQWAIYRIVHPLLERQFISDSYACRVGKGTHAAADKVQYWLRKLDRSPGKPYVLKLDVSKYFYRIDHAVLSGMLQRKIKCTGTLWLLETVITCDETPFGIQLGDHHYEQERLNDVGMPIGNLTSQMFANLYLNELDQFAKHVLREKYYIRYMDDVLVFGTDKRHLRVVQAEIKDYLRRHLRLELNNKTAIRPTSLGVDFVGYVMWPTHRRLRKSTKVRMKKRLKAVQKAYSRGDMALSEVNATVQSYIGICRHCDSRNLLERVFGKMILQRGEERDKH